MKFKHILFVVIFFSTKIYSFYDFYGDTEFQYKVVFEGQTILSSQFLQYTNTNSTFCFNYAVKALSHLSRKDQMVMSWKFSSLKKSNLPNIITSLWDYQMQKQQQETVYSVKLSNDQFFAVDKQGTYHPSGYVLMTLFPIIDVKKSFYEQTHSIDIRKDNNNKNTININVYGWDFFRYKRPNTAEPLILLETNTQFINEIYQEYANQRNSNQYMIFWMQNFQAIERNMYNQIKNQNLLTGMYFIDVLNQMMIKATIMGKISMEVPYEYAQFKVPINLELEGKFTVIMEKPEIGILQQNRTQ